MTLAQARILRSETAREEGYAVVDNDLLPALEDFISEYANDLRPAWRNIFVAIQQRLEKLREAMDNDDDDNV